MTNSLRNRSWPSVDKAGFGPIGKLGSDRKDLIANRPESCNICHQHRPKSLGFISVLGLFKGDYFTP
jgi:hypothetical protein